jgi:hypothetical protein
VDNIERPEYHDIKAKRASRVALAQALLDGKLSVARTEIRNTNSERIDVFVVGAKEDLSDIGPVWVQETQTALGMAYEHISAWMVIAPTGRDEFDQRPLFIIRDKDAESMKKGGDRLQLFLADAIAYINEKAMEDVAA